MHQYAQLEDTVYFGFAANLTTGAAGDGATPLFDVRLCGAAAGAAPVLSGTPTLLTHANYTDGLHEVAVAATAGNGFAAGNTYLVFATLTIDSVTPASCIGSFKIAPVPANVTQWLGTAPATPTVAGVPEVDVTHLLGTGWMAPGVAGTPDVNVKLISGDATAADNLEAAADGGSYNLGGGGVVAASVTGNVGGNVAGSVNSVTSRVTANVDQLGGVAQSLTDLKDFADDGYDPATNKVQGVVLTDTVTTYTGNTPQTGDAFARLGAPAGASVSADIAAIEAQTDDIGAAGAGLTAVPWNAAWDAEVQSEVEDGLAAYGPLKPTVAGRTLDVTATGEAGVDLDNTTGTLAKGTDITGFNDLSAAQVNAEADTALADVGVTTTVTGRIDAAITSRLATAGYTAPPTAIQNADAYLDRTDAVEVGLTPRQQMRLGAAADAGKVSGAATSTIVIRNAVADSKTRLTVTVDASGNRSAVTADVT